jgi:hypothetical protein
MTALAPTAVLPRRPSRVGTLAALATLARRRFRLVARTPRELLVPLLTPIMFALAGSFRARGRAIALRRRDPGLSGCPVLSTRGWG